MNILVILGHPRPGSLNHALAVAACAAARRNGHTVTFHDLHAERFEPCLPAEEIADDGPVPPEIRRHCEDLRAADGIVIVHPNWWGQPPAILKGWIDRVIRAGVAYRFLESDGGDGVPVGLLKAKAALVFNTSNTPLPREQDVFGDPLDTLWRNCVFGLCGVPRVERRMFNVVVTSTPGQRRAWLAEVDARVSTAFPANEVGLLIRPCTDRDFEAIYAIVNDAAVAYKGVIPADCWHEPYMPRAELQAAIASGIEFWGCEMDGALVGVMGIQPVQDVTLIRHAYVRTDLRRHGIGGQLLRFLLARCPGPTLIGTWAAADWAIRFYEKHGFRLVSPAEKDRLLPRYWGVPPRQIAASVVLANERWLQARTTV